MYEKLKNVGISRILYVVVQDVGDGYVYIGILFDSLKSVIYVIKHIN